MRSSSAAEISDKFKLATKKYRDTDGYKAVAKRHDTTDKRRLAKKLYRETEDGRQATRRYNQSSKHRTALYVNNVARRARKRSAEGKFTVEDERKLRDRQKKCHICHKPFAQDDPATRDHVIPLARGGSNNPSNIALAHASCNRAKRDYRTHLI